MSVALHILLHLKEEGQVLTSEKLGPMLKLNPVVVRRTISGLREAGIVRSEKGHGGGWSLARGLDQVTLEDVYDALGMPVIFSIGHRDEKPRCALEQAVNRSLGGALDEAQALLLAKLRSVTVEDLLRDARESAPRARKGARPHA